MTAHAMVGRLGKCRNGPLGAEAVAAARTVCCHCGMRPVLLAAVPGNVCEDWLLFEDGYGHLRFVVLGPFRRRFGHDFFDFVGRPWQPFTEQFVTAFRNE